MSSPISHSILGLSLYNLIGKPKILFNGWRGIIIILFVGLLSDIDMFFVVLTNNMYIHRGITHSIFFALSAAFILSLIFLFKEDAVWEKIFMLFLMLTLAHIFIDYITIDDLPPAGIKLFWPFNNINYQSPYCIFPGFDWETPKGLFSLATVRSFLFEFIVCLPALLFTIWVGRYRKARNKKLCLLEEQSSL